MVEARFLLDSNAVSEPVRPAPRSAFMSRLEAHRGVLAVASTTWAELVFGVERLPPSRRRSELEAYLLHSVLPNFQVLPFDLDAAAWHGRERARLQAAGLTAPFEDGQVAAVAATRGLTLVTANVRHFKHFAGLTVVDWSET